MLFCNDKSTKLSKYDHKNTVYTINTVFLHICCQYQNNHTMMQPTKHRLKSQQICKAVTSLIRFRMSKYLIILKIHGGPKTRLF